MKPVRILFISDIHLSHPTVSTESICNNLRKYLFPKLDSTDILILGGDIFDGSASLNDVSAREALSFISELLYLLNKYNVYTVVIRGTVSHDRNQCRLFQTLHAQWQCKNEFVYRDTISLVHISKFDLNLIVVPDDLPYKSTQEVMAVIYELYTSVGKRIDYVAIHGYFKHQIPQNVPKPPRICFDANDFPFVSRYIFTGHEHKSGQYKNVLTNGSFDRLSHGAQEPKGFLYVVDDGVNTKIEFVENKDASIFETLDFRDIDDVSTIYSKIDSTVSSVGRDTIHLRFVVSTNKANVAIRTYVHQKYPNVVCKFKYDSEDVDDIVTTPILEQDKSLLSPITLETLPTHIHTFLHDRGVQLDLLEIQRIIRGDVATCRETSRV